MFLFYFLSFLRGGRVVSGILVQDVGFIARLPRRKKKQTLVAFFSLCEKSLPPSTTPGEHLKNTLQTQPHGHGYRAGRRVSNKMASLLSGRRKLTSSIHLPFVSLPTPSGRSAGAPYRNSAWIWPG